MNKQLKWRQKNRFNGDCTRCGKPAAPYTDCEECRSKKNVYRALRKLELLGAVIRNEDGEWIPTNNPVSTTRYCIKDNDRRKLPRLKNKPCNQDQIVDFIIDHMVQNGVWKDDSVKSIFARNKARFCKLQFRALGFLP